MATSIENWSLHHTAQVLEVLTPWGFVRHLKIWRDDHKPIVAEWSVIQEIKNDMLGEDAYAVEVYPQTSNVVDEANYRHLWEIPADHIPPFGLHLTRRY